MIDYYDKKDTEETVVRLSGHTASINSISFTPFESSSTLFLGSVSDDSTCRIWDVFTKSADVILLGSPGIAVRWNRADPFLV